MRLCNGVVGFYSSFINIKSVDGVLSRTGVS